jgi:uncharacterized protein (TIGR00375 family)
MRYIADIQIHSKYSRATSKDMEVVALDGAAKKKGIFVMGTGDFTHPDWFGELKKKLVPAPEKGLFLAAENSQGTRFMLTAEISSIYSKGGKVRRVHNLIFAPSFEVVEQINTQLSWVGNLRSDGRPILGLDSKELMKIVLNISQQAYVIPAHIWTPWFSVFGSMSGFDSLEECFEEYADKIIAVETGLSSDPAMNWRLSQLDKVALISNSDSHSLPKIGREANAFEGEEISYDLIFDAIKQASPNVLNSKDPGSADEKLKLDFTIEFFPEEGKYHYDGHRAHKVIYSPKETKEKNKICHVCGKAVTVGVMSRVEELADRPEGYKPEKFIPYKSLVPLEEIIAEALGQRPRTKAVIRHYESLVTKLNSEFEILLDAEIDDIEKAGTPEIAEGVKRVRAGKLKIEPGYDGEYGKISIFDEGEKSKLKDSKQKSLF